MDVTPRHTFQVPGYVLETDSALVGSTRSRAGQARALVLGSLAPRERAAVIQAMSEDEAAAVLVVMTPEARSQTLLDLTAVDPTLATCTVHHIRCSSQDTCALS